MENTGIWVVGFIILFILGSIFGLRVSPREKALGEMRDKARKMGLHPRLVAAPDWTKIPMASENRASMVAYYSVLIPEARLHLPIELKGIYAIDMQANCVGLYWDEHSDLRATQLDAMKAYLQSLAEL